MSDSDTLFDNVGYCVGYAYFHSALHASTELSGFRKTVQNCCAESEIEMQVAESCHKCRHSAAVLSTSTRT